MSTHPQSEGPTHRDDDRPVLVHVARAVEEADELDPAVDALRPVATALVDGPWRRWLLLGRPLGHALHPLLTDVPMGAWMSASFLDLAGPGSQAAARRLVGVGVLAAVPTAITGLAEWSGTSRRDARVGVVHAAGNGVGLALAAASWMARRRDHHALGAVLGLGVLGAVGVSGFLGAHLSIARGVGSRDPEFEDRGAAGAGLTPGGQPDPSPR